MEWVQHSVPLQWLRGATVRGKRVALVVLLAGLVFTAWGAYVVQADVKAKAQREFEFACYEVETRIEDRLAAHAQLLASGAAMFDSSNTVTRQEWKTFVDRLMADEYLRGIEGTGFSQWIPPGQLEAHIEQVRREGFPDYTVRPEGERATYSSIVYLEPFAGRNLRAFGFDMFSEPVRRAAMERARDEGRAALSGKVTLVQETGSDVQAGALMYVPVYTPGAPIDTVQERRAALRGWVYSPYRMGDLLNSVLGDWGTQGELRTISVYDGDQVAPDALLYDSRATASVTASATESGDEIFSLEVPVDLAGRRWTVRCAEWGDFLSTMNDPRVWSVLAGGSLTSLLLAGLVLSLYDTRYRARKLALQLTDELRQSEVKYRTVADFTYAWEAWRRPDGTYVYTSPSCERITGHAAAEFMADGTLMERIVHPDDTAAWVAHLHDLSGSGDDNVRELDLRIVKPCGEVRWISHSCRPVYGDGGQYLGRRESNRDSTERKHQEAQVLERSTQLAQAVAELQQAAKLKDEFMSAVSHELRTPLTGILSMAEVLELSAGGLLDERQLRYVHAIRQSGERLHELIKSILRYTELVAGKVRVAAEPCRLQEVAAAAVRLAQPQVERKGQRLEVSVDPADLTVTSDVQILKEILWQLLDNAVKFTPDGGRIGVDIRREAHPNAAPGSVVLVVWDTGIGIPPDQHEHIFQPFTQVDGSLARRYEGVGLGLASVQRLVELLGGTVSLESAEGEGSRFTVTLPQR